MNPFGSTWCGVRPAAPAASRAWLSPSVATSSGDPRYCQLLSPQCGKGPISLDTLNGATTIPTFSRPTTVPSAIPTDTLQGARRQRDPAHDSWNNSLCRRRSRRHQLASARFKTEGCTIRTSASGRTTPSAATAHVVWRHRSYANAPSTHRRRPDAPFELTTACRASCTHDIDARRGVSSVFRRSAERAEAVRREWRNRR